MIRKWQIPAKGASAFQIFAGLALEFCPQLVLFRHSAKFATEPAIIQRRQPEAGSESLECLGRMHLRPGIVVGCSSGVLKLGLRDVGAMQHRNLNLDVF